MWGEVGDINILGCLLKNGLNVVDGGQSKNADPFGGGRFLDS